MKFDVDRWMHSHAVPHKGTKHPWAARKMADAIAQRGVFEAHRETDHEPGTWSSSAQRHAWPEKKLQLRWCRSQTSTSLRTDGAMWTSLETKARRSPSAELKVPWQNLPGAPPQGPLRSRADVCTSAQSERIAPRTPLQWWEKEGSLYKIHFTLRLSWVNAPRHQMDLWQCSETSVPCVRKLVRKIWSLRLLGPIPHPQVSPFAGDEHREGLVKSPRNAGGQASRRGGADGQVELAQGPQDALGVIPSLVTHSAWEPSGVRPERTGVNSCWKLRISWRLELWWKPDWQMHANLIKSDWTTDRQLDGVPLEIGLDTESANCFLMRLKESTNENFAQLRRKHLVLFCRETIDVWERQTCSWFQLYKTCLHVQAEPWTSVLTVICKTKFDRMVRWCAQRQWTRYDGSFVTATRVPESSFVFYLKCWHVMSAHCADGSSLKNQVIQKSSTCTTISYHGSGACVMRGVWRKGSTWVFWFAGICFFVVLTQCDICTVHWC